MNITDNKNAANFLYNIESFQCGDESLCVALRCILNSIKNFIPYVQANIWLLNEHRNFQLISFPDTLSLICSSENNDEIDNIDNVYLELNDSYAGKAILQEKILRCGDISIEKIFKNTALVDKIGAKAIISIPIHKASWRKNDKSIGVINLFFRELPNVKDEDLNFIAHNVSNSIERLKLIHRDLVTARLLPYSSGSLDKQYENSIKAMNYYGIKAVSIFMLDKTRNTLNLVATTGIEGISDIKQVKYDIGHGLTGTVAQQKKSLIVHNLQCPRIINIHVAAYAEATSDPCQSFMAFPIINRMGKLVGVIRCVNKYLNNKYIASFSKLDLNIVKRIADILCQHMERSSLEKTRKALLAKIPHDLKAPIVAVRNNAENIKNYSGYPNFDVEQKLDDIIDDCNTMFVLLDQIKRERKYEFEQVQLKGEVLVKAIKELRPLSKLYKLKSIRYGRSLNNIPINLWLDRTQMQHLFYNLIINAIKYSYEDTEVILTSRRTKYELAIDISNLGIGIDEAYKEIIFEPEVRTEEAQDVDVTGTGWGLTIAKEIAEEHGGRIEVTRLRNPTIFTLFLPLTLCRSKPK